jgi:prophage regulatory protein
MSEQVRSAITILRRKQVESRTGLSRSSIYAMMAKSHFPKNVSLGGGRSVGWIESEIDQWLERLTVKTMRDELQQSGNPDGFGSDQSRRPHHDGHLLEHGIVEARRSRSSGSGR